MAESSFLWSAPSAAGDGNASFTRSDWSNILKVVGACLNSEGVAAAYLNALAGTVTGANTVSINTGGALVDGKPYYNNAAVSVNIPSAVGGGNTRIDRVVLRADWTAQTVRITRIAGTDAASPTAPAITQTTGVLYDVQLYQALVNTSGTVTLTDERTFAQISNLNQIAAALITAAKLALNTVDNTILRQGTALTVIGRSANSTGNVADIGAAAASGAVLRESGSTIGFGTIAAAALGAAIVDITKIGNRVLGLTERQGNSASQWHQAGSTTYTPTLTRTVCGVALWSGASANSGNVVVTLSTAFSDFPLVVACQQSNASATTLVSVVPSSSSTFTIYWTDTLARTVIAISWIAIGPG